MSIAVVVPWGRPDGEAGEIRQAVWDWCRARWEASGLDLIIAADPEFQQTGKFSVSRAINSAVRHAPPETDRFFCIGADALPTPKAVVWADRELDRWPWTLIYDHGGGYGKGATAEIVEHASMGTGDPLWPEFAPFETPCVGPIAFTRRTWEDVGGYDEKYQGWAYEDVDFWLRLTNRYPNRDGAYSDQPLIQLWHPVDHHDLTRDNPNVVRFHERWC